MPGLLLTLTLDCVYEIAHTTHRWTGHTGAAKFYNELLGAFPDISFHLRNIVIGPQGVWEEADVQCTWGRPWSRTARRAVAVPVAARAFGGGPQAVLNRAAQRIRALNSTAP